jgi:acetyl-CoA/propionyl-CoA carboxylase biotin carboxyl carrier protein
MVWDVDREAATRRMLRALWEFEVGGLKTLIGFHRSLLETEQWKNAQTCRDLLEDRDWLRQLSAEPAEAEQGQTGDQTAIERTYAVEVSGRRFDVKVIGEPPSFNGVGVAKPQTRKPPKRGERSGASGSDSEQLISPLQGTVLRVATEQGAQVEAGALICVIEAMKMENEIAAHRSGTIAELGVTEGAPVTSGDTIAVIR